MNEINGRVAIIRKNLNITQTDFAKSLSIGQQALSMIETGKRELSEKNIKLICLTYNINEKWLRTGEGEMYMPEMDEDAAYVSDLLEDTDDTVYRIIKGIMKTYKTLGEKEKETLRNFAQDFLDNMKDGG